MRLITGAAIYGSVTARLKWYLRLLPAARAGGAIHLARFVFAHPATSSTRIIPLPSIGLLVRGSALWAAARGVGQSPAFIKFLLADGKRKGLPAVAAVEGLIAQWHLFFSILGLAQLMYPSYSTPRWREVHAKMYEP